MKVKGQLKTTPYVFSIVVGTCGIVKINEKLVLRTVTRVTEKSLFTVQGYHELELVDDVIISPVPIWTESPKENFFWLDMITPVDWKLSKQTGKLVQGKGSYPLETGVFINNIRDILVYNKIDNFYYFNLTDEFTVNDIIF